MAAARRKKRTQQTVSPEPSNEPSLHPQQIDAWFFGGRGLWVCLGLILINLAVYEPTRRLSFVSFDDPFYITDNPQVSAGLTWKGVIWAFTTGHASNWHPLTWLSHMLDISIFGITPGAMHAVNVAFHTANSVLLFGLLYTMTSALAPSAFVAALFAVHPLHVESVAWISERKDVLSTLFWILTIWAYVAWVRTRSLKRYLWALILFGIGLTAKPMLVTLPFVLLLLDVWPLNRIPGLKLHPSIMGPLLLEKLPLLGMAAASSVVTFIVQRQGGSVATLDTVPLDLRTANALLSYVIYIANMIWPSSLAALYPFPKYIPLWETVGSASVLVAMSLIAVRMGKRHPYVFTGWFWYLGTLAPVVGLVQVGIQSRADRYTYVPLVGLFIVIAWTLQDITSRRSAWTFPVAGFGALAIIVCIVVARTQVKYWQDGFTLWRRTVDVTSENYQAQRALGDEFWGRKDASNAVLHYTEALRIEPRYAEVHNKLGVVLADQGKTAEAASHYMEAVRLKPTLKEAHNNLGNVAAGQGKFDEAVAHYTEALRVQPDDAQAHNGLGSVLDDQGKTGEAIAHYRAALRSQPSFAEAHNNLAAALVKEDKFDEAIEAVQQAIRLKPDNPDFHYNAAVILQHQGRSAEAKQEFDATAKLRGSPRK
jgi:Flp pilus assembly protein TadD